MDLRPASQTVKGKGCATCLNLLNISNYLIFKGWGGSKLHLINETKGMVTKQIYVEFSWKKSENIKNIKWDICMNSRHGIWDMKTESANMIWGDNGIKKIRQKFI